MQHNNLGWDPGTGEVGAHKNPLPAHPGVHPGSGTHVECYGGPHGDVLGQGVQEVHAVEAGHRVVPPRGVDDGGVEDLGVGRDGGRMTQTPVRTDCTHLLCGKKHPTDSCLTTRRQQKL